MIRKLRWWLSVSLWKLRFFFFFGECCENLVDYPERVRRKKKWNNYNIQWKLINKRLKKIYRLMLMEGPFFFQTLPYARSTYPKAGTELRLGVRRATLLLAVCSGSSLWVYCFTTTDFCLKFLKWPNCLFRVK